MITAISIVGCNLCIKTVMFACAKTMGLVKYISQDTSHFETLNELLMISDIKKRVAKIHKLLTLDDVKHEVIDMAIQDLHESITNINKLLEQCIMVREEHDAKYLANWRTLYIPEKELNIQIQLFNIRFDDLVKITTIIKNIYN